MSRPTGKCRLCGQTKELHDGHVFPKHLYKMYAIEQGGRHYDLQSDSMKTEQITFYWCCQECENKRLGRFETRGAAILRAVDGAPAVVQQCDKWFYGYLVSIAWRVLMSDLKGKTPTAAEMNVIETWREFLFNPEKNRADEQVYVVTTRPIDGHPGMFGGHYCRELGFVYLHIGRLVAIVFTKEPKAPKFPPSEMLGLKKRRIWPTGGNILPPPPKLRVVINGEGDLPLTLARYLFEVQKLILETTYNSETVKKERIKKRLPLKQLPPKK
jgi:hypothetical protein